MGDAVKQTFLSQRILHLQTTTYGQRRWNGEMEGGRRGGPSAFGAGEFTS